MHLFRKEIKAEKPEDQSDEDTDDTIDRIADGNTKSERKGRSFFRNEQGGPNYLKVDQTSRISSESRSRSRSKSPLLSKRNELPSQNKANSKLANVKNVKEEDKLPHHSTPKDKKIVESDQSKTYKLFPNQGKTPNKDAAKDEAPRSNLVRRRGKPIDQTNLTVDTRKDREIEFEAIPLQSSGLDYKRRSSTPMIELKRRQESNSPPQGLTRARRSSVSSQISPTNFRKVRKSILSSIPQDQLDQRKLNGASNTIEMTQKYLDLVNLLNIYRTFFDPELEVVNRYCLEHTAICVKTESKSMFVNRAPKPHLRVFQFMEDFISTSSTPLDTEPHGPEVPALLAKLFHGDFRINSKGKNKVGINIPLFSHSHKMTADKFKAITDNVYARKRYFYKNTDISRHNLEHLI